MVSGLDDFIYSYESLITPSGLDDGANANVDFGLSALGLQQPLKRHVLRVCWAPMVEHVGPVSQYLPRPHNVPLQRALWSLLDCV